MFYPKNKIKPNQYTTGNEFQYVGTQEVYVGDYYATYDGKFFTGKTFNPNDSRRTLELERIPSNPEATAVTLSVVENEATQAYLKLKSPQSGIEVPQLRMPQPTEEDYNEGQFVRYFAVKRNQPIYIEIDSKTANRLNSQNNSIDWKHWLAFGLEWRISNAPAEFVATKNRDAVIERSRANPGFDVYIGDNYTYGS